MPLRRLAKLLRRKQPGPSIDDPEHPEYADIERAPFHALGPGDIALDLGANVVRSRPLNRYALERRLLLRLRRNIRHNAFGKLVKRLRWACDVLLR